MKLTTADQAAIAPALEQTVKDFAELIARTEPDTLRALMETAEAFSRTYRHPRQILHNGRKPR